jgi:hypothetical protein
MTLVLKTVDINQEGVTDETFQVHTSDVLFNVPGDDGLAALYIEEMSERYGALAVAKMADASFVQKVRQEYAKRRAVTDELPRGKESAEDCDKFMQSEEFLIVFNRKRADHTKKMNDTLESMSKRDAYNFFISKGFDQAASAEASGFTPHLEEAAA